MGRFVNSEVNARPSKLFWGGYTFGYTFSFFPLLLLLIFFAAASHPRPRRKKMEPRPIKVMGNMRKYTPHADSLRSLFLGGGLSPQTAPKEDGTPTDKSNGKSIKSKQNQLNPN